MSVDNGTTASYAYDQQNRRYKKTVGSSVTHYVWQGSQVLAEHNGSTGAVQVNYIYAGSRMIAKVASGTTSYFLSDRLSIRLTTNTSGSVTGQQGHLPFGEDFAESGSQQKQHFTTYDRDSQSGSDYAINRRHQPATGRFMQADPYQASGGVADPQSWNRYAYVGNDPVNFTDPSGLKRMYFVLNFYMADPSYNAWGYMDVPDSNSSPEDGMGTGGSKAEKVHAVANKLKDILKEKNPCSDFFGGSDVALAALAQWQAIIAQATNGETKKITNSMLTVVPESGGQTFHGYTVRTPVAAYFNPDGAFFNTSYLQGTTAIPFSNLGSFSTIDTGGRAIQILHELAHLVVKPDGTLLIPHDGNSDDQSHQNTEQIVEACNKTLKKALK